MSTPSPRSPRPPPWPRSPPLLVAADARAPRHGAAARWPRPSGPPTPPARTRSCSRGRAARLGGVGWGALGLGAHRRQRAARASSAARRPGAACTWSCRPPPAGARALAARPRPRPHRPRRRAAQCSPPPRRPAVAGDRAGRAPMPDWPPAAAPPAVPDWPAARRPQSPRRARRRPRRLPLAHRRRRDLPARVGRPTDGREVAGAVHAWWSANAAVIGPDPDLLLPGQVLTPPAPP